MILVDSSIWINYLRGNNTPQASLLETLLGFEVIAVGDLMLAEILQGCVHDKEFEATRRALAQFDVVNICTPKTAVQAARNYRALREHGVTVRKTIDTLIATCCIENNLALLHSDRDFDHFAAHLGLRTVAGVSRGKVVENHHPTRR